MVRLNKFIAQHTSLSRRKADEHIIAGNIYVNGSRANAGYDVQPGDKVTSTSIDLIINIEAGTQAQKPMLIALNKPVGYVCSRDGQGSKTIYSLLPKEHQRLNTVGRLDKDSSGLILLTNDGDLAQRLAHPSFEKVKKYRVILDRELSAADLRILRSGVDLDDGTSKFDSLSRTSNSLEYEILMHEGKNRQIRRTFKELGYTVENLHRIAYGKYQIGSLKPGAYQEIDPQITHE